MAKQQRAVTNAAERRVNEQHRSLIRDFDLPKMTNVARSYEKCRQCGAIYVRDYQPRSLSNPIMTLPCHHDAYRTITVTFTEARKYFQANAKKEQRLAGMTQGIVYACAEIAQANPQIAKEILRASGIDLADAKKHRVAKYDLDRIRTLLKEIEAEDK